MIVILHNIRSLHNVGSIFRTADAVGVEKIYLTGITPKPVDRFGKPRRQFIKVSLGAEKTVPWTYAKSATTLIKKLSAGGGSPPKARLAEGGASGWKKEKYRIFAIEQNAHATPYYELRTSNKKKKIALVLGHECRGLPPSILKLADKILEIPMGGAMIRQAHHPRHLGRGKESLNVAVAFGIVAYRVVETQLARDN